MHYHNVIFSNRSCLIIDLVLFENRLSCLCFGFLWWLPLKRQMKKETFTDADFVRHDDDIVIRHD